MFHFQLNLVIKLFSKIHIKTRKRLLLVSIVPAIILLSFYLISNAGVWLVKKDKLEKADAIVILMGSIADRILEAKDLYTQGYSKKILVVNSYISSGKELEPYGIHVPNNSELSKKALVQLGIPDSLIHILPASAISTQEEAYKIAEYVSSNPKRRSILLVTSNSHSLRATMIFEDTFNDQGIEAKIITAPSKYTEYNAQQWWSDRQSAKQVFFEYAKIISFLLFERYNN